MASKFDQQKSDKRQRDPQGRVRKEGVQYQKVQRKGDREDSAGEYRRPMTRQPFALQSGAKWEEETEAGMKKGLICSQNSSYNTAHVPAEKVV